MLASGLWGMTARGKSSERVFIIQHTNCRRSWRPTRKLATSRLLIPTGTYSQQATTNFNPTRTSPHYITLTFTPVEIIRTHILPLLLQYPFNGLFSRTTWVSRYQKGKPVWILLEQEMMGWQWHQLDHMQITCTSIQTDNHASTSPRRIYLRIC